MALPRILLNCFSPITTLAATTTGVNGPNFATFAMDQRGAAWLLRTLVTAQFDTTNELLFCPYTAEPPTNPHVRAIFFPPPLCTLRDLPRIAAPTHFSAYTAQSSTSARASLPSPNRSATSRSNLR
eukprot:CAMPEP_0198722738 /NCGR_PEP_ID=MMETSP1475-20131203/361_1 /TAXON_ID= ORGANISM="Unidentified sp., Strain CCMP1999" /NCGR_SAMPLE_ID=MMETSP1475 /ASSEMBLY_ACC=CAM_ASM_001111 /LENGTH=125 /DNA_ID=CAMNT_0044483655 /DNA_START=394 /DNA_END=768 /DNA_ORIENTATION=-